MIEIEKTADNVITMSVSGRIEKAGINEAVTMLDDMLAQMQTANILVDLTHYEGMSMEALIADTRYGLTHLNELNKYKRIAVITDKDWIEALIWLENKVFSQSDMRCFETDEREKAEAFVNGETIAPKEYAPSVTRIPTSRPDLLAFNIHDKIRGGDATAVFGFLNAAYDAFGKIDLLVAIDDYEGFELGMIFDAKTWKTKTASLSHINRYAIVGGPSFLTSTAQFMGAFMPVDIKVFAKGEMNDALKWLDEKPLLANR